jgi:MFS family permease
VGSLYPLIAVSTTNHFAFTGARLAVVLAGVHLGASPAVVGLLSALFGLLSSFVSVAEGRLIDRVGPVRPMLWCSIAMGLGAVFGFTWHSLWSLAILSTLVGTFYSFFFIGHTQWIGRIGGSDDRVRNYSLASLGFSLATFSGPLVTGVVIDHFGHDWAFVVIAVVPFFAVAVLGSGRVAPPPLPKAARAERHRQSVMDLVRDPKLFRVYLVSVIANATWSIVNFLIPVYGTQIGLSASKIGLLMGSYSIAMIVIRAFMPMLHRRFTGWQLMILSLASSAFCFVAMPLVTSLTVLMVLAFLIGLGMGLSGPLSQALLYEASPPERVGEVMGLRVTAMNVTQTVVPIGSGAVSAALGNGPVFWALALVLVGGSYAVRGQWQRPRARSTSR